MCGADFFHTFLSSSSSPKKKLFSNDNEALNRKDINEAKHISIPLMWGGVSFNKGIVVYVCAGEERGWEMEREGEGEGEEGGRRGEERR